MRWGIETTYETLKERLQIENFTGTKPILLLQDIYSTIYISNLAEDIIRDAEAEMDEKEKHRKHKIMIDRTLGIGILKNDLIYILLKTDARKQDELFWQIYKDISKNLVPIRPERHYLRTKELLAGKYSNTINFPGNCRTDRRIILFLICPPICIISKILFCIWSLWYNFIKVNALPGCGLTCI